MFECTYCNLFYEEKKILLAHQKTKKCKAHRQINFICKKCFNVYSGYENILKHVETCETVCNDHLFSIINQLSSTYSLDIKYNKENEGTIHFKKLNVYKHPKCMYSSIILPQKIHLFYKSIGKYDDIKILGSHNGYINDINHKIFRLGDAFQLLCIKYTFKDLMDLLWSPSSSMSCFCIKNDIYILGQVQCKNEINQKWFGDTFILKENENVNKCIWYKDPSLKQFFSLLNPLLKEILNLYLNLCNWILKKKKIAFKFNKEEVHKSYCRIDEIIEEYNLQNLVENIQILNCYSTFSSLFKPLLEHYKNTPYMLHTNIQHVFKDELLPSAINEEYSLMTMSDHELTRNYFYLMDYILPESEKKIFRSKT